jgi:hypothetical protein
LKNMPKLDHTHTTEKMENGDRVDQIIFEDWCFKTLEMYVRVGRGFNMVKMILNNLRHRKLCARRVPQMVMSHHK